LTLSAAAEITARATDIQPPVTIVQRAP
jgi:hypothetical protein